MASPGGALFFPMSRRAGEGPQREPIHEAAMVPHVCVSSSVSMRLKDGCQGRRGLMGTGGRWRFAFDHWLVYPE